MSRGGASQSATANFALTGNPPRRWRELGTPCEACGRRVSDGDSCDRPREDCSMRVAGAGACLEGTYG
jgi:hypothetical protein